MSQAIDITAEQRETVRSLLAKHLPNTKVWAYGSRVRWTSRPESDLDMAVFATPEQERAVSDLREAFEESNLTFRVDLFVWDEVPEGYREQIEREHVVLQSAKGMASAECVGQDGWVHLNLGRICTKIGSGATPRGGKEVYVQQNGEYALIRSQNVLNDGFRDEGLAYIGRVHALQLKNVEVFDGDVLLNITGDSVARVCQVRSDVLPARVNQHVAIIRPHPEKLDPRFLRYALVSPKMQTNLLSWAGSGATRNALTKGMIESLDVAAPRDVGEQRAIAQILGTLDDRIELNHRMNETLEAIARGLFKSWFVDFEPVRAKMAGRDTGLARAITDRFPGHLNEHGMPDGWHRPQLGQMLTVLETGRRPKGGVAHIREGIPSVGAESIVKVGHFDFSKTKYVRSDYFDSMSRGHVLDGDVLIYKDGGKPGELRPAVTYVSEGFPFPRFCINEHVFRVRTDAVSQQMLYMALSTDDAFWQMRELATGVAQPGLNQSAVRSLRITMPNDDVLMQHAGALIDPILDRCNRNSIDGHRLASVRDLLLPKLLSGELRVPDAERIAAAVI